MNNSRYLREFDFGRFDFYYRTGLLKHAHAQKGVYIVQHAASIRYRRSVNFLVPYKIVTRLVHFDTRSWYFEQKIVTIPDEFVRAVAYCKNTAVNFDVEAYMKKAYGMTPPSPIPEDLELWIKSNEMSSNKLRLQGHGSSVATNLAGKSD
eukprot:TRINITY_DN4551_c0_g1_i2.p2 TRINITY_DN4551_c0_g1~~TRINITY_DN4551_c0_g1_i2.p2  ORF type:complete len:150 (+),score=33.66 TRINITY_DN4551_c0_g1_i2:776-1225(+)